MSQSSANASYNEIDRMYLELLKKTLIRWGDNEYLPTSSYVSYTRRLLAWAVGKRLTAADEPQLFRQIPFDAVKRNSGLDWPSQAETMIGLKRLNNIQHCVETVLRDNIAGDLVETGVWRGGASIFMAALLKVFHDEERLVWCADSFQGLPAPDVDKYPQDKDVTWHMHSELAVSLDEVKRNFLKYDLLDDRVRFLPGWFRDTLHQAPISRIAVLRLDGDMYESTIDALNPLYDKVSPGGFIIVDDYGLPEDTCYRAIHDFRSARGITEEIVRIDEFGAYWRRAN